MTNVWIELRINEYKIKLNKKRKETNMKKGYDIDRTNIISHLINR
jgi:hypothetical protein